MHLIWRLANVSAVLALVASRAAAQDNHRVALDIGIPAGVAILWHVNDKVDFRPDFSWLHISEQNAGDQTHLGFGASLLFPVKSTTPFTPYLGVRGGYTYASGTNAPTEWSLSGIFGGRYTIDKRFGISAETGLEYDHIHQPGNPFTTTLSAFEPWGRVSALLYF